jgi:diacylglycerol kinase family enzyme
VKKKEDELHAELMAAFERHAIDAKIQFVEGPELQEQARQSVKKAATGEFDAIVAGGGDGTIRTVAGALIAADIPIGVIPLGTLNHFARDLKIPSSIADAVSIIAAGAVRRVDVGKVNDQIFLNNSSIGIYPYLVLDRDRRRERRGLSKWPAMILASLRAFRSPPLRRLTIRAGDRHDAYRSPCVFIGNNAYELRGSAFGKRQALDRGELVLFVAKQQSRLGLLWLGLKCVFGVVDQRSLRNLNVTDLEVSSRRRRLLVALDGEIQTMETPLRYKIMPAALRVLAPAARSFPASRSESSRCG